MKPLTVALAVTLLIAVAHAAASPTIQRGDSGVVDYQRLFRVGRMPPYAWRIVWVNTRRGTEATIATSGNPKGWIVNGVPSGVVLVVPADADYNLPQFNHYRVEKHLRSIRGYVFGAGDFYVVN